MNGYHQHQSMPKNSNNKHKTSRKGPIPMLSGKELCVICGANSTGFNYGVLSCEGCKAFYRRTVKMIDDDRLKTNNGRVDNLDNKPSQIRQIYECINKDNHTSSSTSFSCNLFNQGRHKCRACRLIKCKQAGMSNLGRFKQRPDYLQNKTMIKKAQRMMVSKNKELVANLKRQSYEIQEDPSIRSVHQIYSNKIPRRSISEPNRQTYHLQNSQLQRQISTKDMYSPATILNSESVYNLNFQNHETNNFCMHGNNNTSKTVPDNNNHVTLYANDCDKSISISQGKISDLKLIMNVDVKKDCSVGNSESPRSSDGGRGGSDDGQLYLSRYGIDASELDDFELSNCDDQSLVK